MPVPRGAWSQGLSLADILRTPDRRDAAARWWRIPLEPRLPKRIMELLPRALEDRRDWSQALEILLAGDPDGPRVSALPLKLAQELRAAGLAEIHGDGRLVPAWEFIAAAGPHMGSCPPLLPVLLGRLTLRELEDLAFELDVEAPDHLDRRDMVYRFLRHPEVLRRLLSHLPQVGRGLLYAMVDRFGAPLLPAHAGAAEPVVSQALQLGVLWRYPDADSPALTLPLEVASALNHLRVEILQEQRQRVLEELSSGTASLKIALPSRWLVREAAIRLEAAGGAPEEATGALVGDGHPSGLARRAALLAASVMATHHDGQPVMERGSDAIAQAGVSMLLDPRGPHRHGAARVLGIPLSSTEQLPALADKWIGRLQSDFIANLAGFRRRIQLPLRQVSTLLHRVAAVVAADFYADLYPLRAGGLQDLPWKDAGALLSGAGRLHTRDHVQSMVEAVLEPLGIATIEGGLLVLESGRLARIHRRIQGDDPSQPEDGGPALFHVCGDGLQVLLPFHHPIGDTARLLASGSGEMLPDGTFKVSIAGPDIPGAERDTLRPALLELGCMDHAGPGQWLRRWLGQPQARWRDDLRLMEGDTPQELEWMLAREGVAPDAVVKLGPTWCAVRRR